MIPKATRIIFLTVLLLLTLTGYALAAGFTDVKGHWAETQINSWVEKGLAAGYSDGTFRPNQQVSRAEFVALVNRAFAIDKKTGGPGFKDVQAGKWYYNDVMAAASAGYIGGYSDGTFGPEKNITRQEAASILVRLLKLTPTTGGINYFQDANKISDWAGGNVGAVVRDGFMKGMPDNTFQPLKSITRAEAIASLDRALSGKKPVQVLETGITGKITYNNSAVKNAIIKLYQADGYEVLDLMQTNETGNYKLNVEPGNYDLTVTTDKEVAYQSDVQVVKDKIARVDLTVQAAALVKGTLKDKNGNPVKNKTLIFTTNPTFTASTDKNGEYTAVLLPGRNYNVRKMTGDADNPTEEIQTGLKVGQAGEQAVDLTTEEETTKTVPAGGGGGGGVAGGNDEQDDQKDQELKVNSVTFVVDGKNVTVTGADNVFNINLSGYKDSQQFTSLTVKASSNAKKASVSLIGVSQEIEFDNGVAEVTVNELIGQPGISLSGLKKVLDLVGDNEISITVTDDSGAEAEVTAKINL